MPLQYHSHAWVRGLDRTRIGWFRPHSWVDHGDAGAFHVIDRAGHDHEIVFERGRRGSGRFSRSGFPLRER